MMSEAKFTKGEWVVFEKETSQFDRCQVNNLVIMPESKKTRYGASFYASIGGFNYHTQKEEAEANAHLIAAAPEMYKMLDVACKEITNLIDEVNKGRKSKVTPLTENEPDLYDGETCYLIQKLLAKARGEK